MTKKISTAKKRGYHHGDLRDTAVRIAANIVEQKGLEGLSLQAVAKHAGVTPMALYRHFESKDELLSAVAQHGFLLLRDALSSNSSRRSTVDILTEWGVTYVLFAKDHANLFKLMFGRPPKWQSPDGAGLADRSDTAFGMLTALMRNMFAAEDVELAVLSAWSFAHGLASLVADKRLNPYPHNVAQLSRHVGRFFAERLVPQKPTS